MCNTVDIHKHFFPVKSEVSYTCGLIMKTMLLGDLSLLLLLKVIFKQQKYDFFTALSDDKILKIIFNTCSCCRWCLWHILDNNHDDDTLADFDDFCCSLFH